MSYGNQPLSALVNGRLMDVSGGVQGSTIAQAAGSGPGRRTTMFDGVNYSAVDHNRVYTPAELVGRNGPVAFYDGPNRIKAR
jgi:hypothetical protein